MTINLLGDAPYPDLFDAIGRFPKYLDLNAKASINANADPNTTNFFSENTKIKIDLNVDLPLAFAAKFTMKDTIDVDFAGINEDDLGKVDSVILQIIVDNEFPIDLSFQTYFIEEKENVIELVDSIFDIPMKITNDVEESIIKISYKSNRIDKLKKVKRAIFVASVQTSEFERLDNEGGHILKEVFGEQSISFYLSTNVWLSPAAE
ncbi:MAG: hypothetical protein B6I24_04560 [Bacteroidetes bacterium 4572_128]|nr:MAG: hypothetical protein B6I24_04560 [Bacteroidetes bacterium 4572_128]